jgi:hypothetical protein
MKILIVLLAFICVSCSKDKTKVETQVAVPQTSGLDCESQRSAMDAAIRRMIPEITTIGDPYVERTTGGKAKLNFTIERCASAAAPDTISQNYHILTYGYVVDTIPTYWYGFYLHKDLNSMIVYDFPTKMQLPLDEIRKTREWIMQWGVRK